MCQICTGRVRIQLPTRGCSIPSASLRQCLDAGAKGKPTSALRGGKQKLFHCCSQRCGRLDRCHNLRCIPGDHVKQANMGINWWVSAVFHGQKIWTTPFPIIARLFTTFQPIVSVQTPVFLAAKRKHTVWSANWNLFVTFYTVRPRSNRAPYSFRRALVKASWQQVSLAGGVFCCSFVWRPSWKAKNFRM